MFWTLVSDYDILKKEQFLNPFFELVSCKPETSGFGGGWGRTRQRSQKKKGIATLSMRETKSKFLLLVFQQTGIFGEWFIVHQVVGLASLALLSLHSV